MNKRLQILSLVFLMMFLSLPVLASENDFMTFSLKSNLLDPQSTTLGFNSDAWDKIRTSYFGSSKSFEFEAGYMEGKILANKVVDTGSVKVTYAILGNMAYSSYVFLQNPYIAAGAIFLTILPGVLDTYPSEKELEKIQHRPPDYHQGFLEGFNDKAKTRRLRDAVVFMAVSYGLSVWCYSNNFK